jgi:hypothetical protein
MRILRLLTLSAVLWAVSCGQAPSGPARQGDPDAVPAVDSGGAGAPVRPEPAGLRAFLLSEPGTYGWQTSADSIMLDFLADGRLHIQGPDGEASMWEGRWRLQEDGRLTLFRADLGREQTLPVAREGERLRLGDRLYDRYRP